MHDLNGMLVERPDAKLRARMDRERAGAEQAQAEADALVAEIDEAKRRQRENDTCAQP